MHLPGGAWSPQDGGHPVHDPTSLIATCVRTVKEAAGVDLAGCNQVCVYLCVRMVVLSVHVC